MREIRANDLRFEEDETGSFLRSFLSRELDSTAISVLLRRTEGWAAGLQLAALALRDRGDAETLLEGLGTEGGQIREFLLAEVLAGLGETRRRYLLATAVLERFCAGLCDAVFPAVRNASSKLGGDAFVAWLQESNLFVICLDDEKRWFRFHHLFRELLVHQLDKTGHSDQVRDIQHRAAAWLEKQGHHDQALSYLLEAGDTDSAVELIKRNRSTQMNREQWSQLDRWIRRLPSERIDREPEILLQQAWVYENRFRYPEMLDLLEKIENLFLERPPSTELQGEFDAIASTRHYLQGDGERAAASARCALHTLPEERLSERGYATVLLTLALQLVNRPDEARQVALEAIEDRRHRGTSLHARCILALCFVHSMEGDMESLLRSSTELLALGQEYSLGESVSLARYFLGSAHWDRNDLEAAKSVLEPLARERVPFQISSQAHGVYLLAKIRALQGQPRESKELLSALASGALGRQHIELIRLADFFAADVALQQGHRRQAMLWAERFEPNLEGPWWLSQLPELTWIKVLIASESEEDRKRGRVALAELAENLETYCHRRLRLEAKAIQAIDEQRQGDSESAKRCLQEAVDLARPRGIIRPFLDLGPEMVVLLAKLDLAIDGQGFVEWIEARLVDPESADSTTVSLPGPTQTPLPEYLTAREIDVLNLLAERLSNKEIGSKLFISGSTVKRHTANIYEKLQVHDRREAVLRAQSAGLFDAG